MCCARLAGNAGPKNRQKVSIWAPSHKNLSGYIFATKACIDNRKKMLNSNISSTCPYSMANFGPLAGEIGSGVWGTPANFKGFRVLAALLHATLVVGVSQTLLRWREGATYIRQGGHHVHILVAHIVLSSSKRCNVFWTYTANSIRLCRHQIYAAHYQSMKFSVGMLILELQSQWIVSETFATTTLQLQMYTVSQKRHTCDLLGL